MDHDEKSPVTALTVAFESSIKIGAAIKLVEVDIMIRIKYTHCMIHEKNVVANFYMYLHRILRTFGCLRIICQQCIEGRDQMWLMMVWWWLM